VQASKESSTITTFTFELPEGKTVEYIPGQHAILDFSAENSNGYRHMADEAPQSLNDDFIRSWTISSIPEIDSSTGNYLPSTKFACTIKYKYGGAVSPMLHRWAKQRHHYTDLNIKFIGVEGAFTCFDACHKLKHGKLLFVAGGVGITPFLSMLAVFKARNIKADVVMLFSARGDDVNLSTRFKDAGISTSVFSTNTKSTEGVDVIERRIAYDDVSGVPDLLERDVYLCGPDGFMQVMKGFLEKAGVEPGKVNVESFAF
jgi:ferredoxin-NADP reductase